MTVSANRHPLGVPPLPVRTRWERVGSLPFYGREREVRGPSPNLPLFDGASSGEGASSFRYRKDRDDDESEWLDQDFNGREAPKADRGPDNSTVATVKSQMPIPPALWSRDDLSLVS